MATAEEIAVLRAKINEPDDENGYTDIKLGALLDAVNGDGDEVAGGIWGEKAARFSTLVNVSESGSSRSLGSLYSNAIAMAKFYGDKATADEPPVVPLVNRARTRAIERI